MFLTRASAALLVATLLGAGACARGADSGSRLPLTRVAQVPLSGGSGRFDYQSIDPSRHLLAIAHLGAGEVILFDLAKRKVVATIGGVSDVRGVLAVPGLHRVYAAATGTHELVAIDEVTHRVVARTPIGSFPDGVAYDEPTGRVFVSDGDAVTVVDSRTGTVVGHVSLLGGVGNVLPDPVTGHLLVNHEGGTTLVELDPKTLAVIRRIALTGCEGNHGLFVQKRPHRAFIACEGNAKLVVVDLAARRQVARLSTGSGPDVLAADPKGGRLYVACESGTVSVFATGAAKVRLLAGAKLADNAHSVAVDPATRLVYFPLTDGGGGKPALRIMRPA